MKTIQNDKGETVIASGAPGSLARCEVQYPAMIERLNSLYNQEARVNDAIDAIRQAGIRSEMETNHLIALSHFSARANQPGTVENLVCGVARSNFNLFSDTYRHFLAKYRDARPDLYGWPMGQLNDVASRMMEAIKRGSFSNDSLAIKETCKYLGIKSTYKAIKEFIQA